MRCKRCASFGLSPRARLRKAGLWRRGRHSKAGRGRNRLSASQGCVGLLGYRLKGKFPLPRAMGTLNRRGDIRSSWVFAMTLSPPVMNANLVTAGFGEALRSDPRVPGPALRGESLFPSVVEHVLHHDALKIFPALVANLAFDSQ